MYLNVHKHSKQLSRVRTVCETGKGTKLSHLLAPGECLSSSPRNNSYLFLGKYQTECRQVGWGGGEGTFPSGLALS